MSKKIKSLVSILGIALVIAYLVLRKFDFFENTEQTSANMPAPGSTQAAAVLPVKAMVAKQESMSNDLRITGTILPNESVILRPEVSGRITGIYFDEGQKVRKGQKLITINDEELLAQLERAKFTKKLIEETEFRQKRLLEREAISKEEYDIAQTELSTAESDIKLLQAQLAKLTLLAPFDGTIGLRYVSLGSYITPSDNIASLFNINPVKIEFSIPAKYNSRVERNMPISFTTDGLEQIFHGNVYAVEPQIDVATRTLKMRATADNQKGLLLPGQFVNIKLTLSTKENAIMVPSQAIVPELQGHKVYVAKNGKAVEQKIALGIRTETTVEILSGINPGDTVITSGILQIRAGTAVNTTIQTN